MDIWIILALVFGVALLTYGGEFLVRGASNLAAGAGISKIVIGLTVVAFGTSSPELFVSLKAAIDGQSDIAMGNVIGSNCFNVLFILGVSALIVPLVVHEKLIRFDVMVMVGVSVLFLLLALDGVIGRVDGAVLVFGLIAYIWYSIQAGKKEGYALSEGEIDTTCPMWKNVLFIVSGLAMLVVGARSFLWSAVGIARLLGVSELVIGLTIVAIATSLPEVATSIIATIRGQRDIAIGNVVGSNIFNILCVVGFTGIIHPIDVAPAALSFDMPVMIAVAFACLPIFYTGLIISRSEGAILLFYYAAYTIFLILDSSGHSAKPLYSEMMLVFVLPVTVATLIAMVVLQKRSVAFEDGGGSGNG